ncbi:ABC transporter substrate-binding protein [Amorphus sp. 3PC139-8]|uniref:ABC transporter substrate-binding protein n=1 Tax=Amorphus sp. 3PC139-8 TaxID=2735676 RepID=UPI00345D4B26
MTTIHPSERRRSLQRLFPMVAAALTLTAAAPATAQELEKTELNVAILPTMDYVPVVIAIEDGLFKDEGLDVTYQVTTAPASLNGVLGGTYDFAGVTWFAFLTAYNRGLPLVAASELDRGTPGYATIAVKGDSPVKTPEDLIGKKVGVLSTNGACDLTLNDVLLKDGKDYQSIEYVALGVPELVSTLMTGGIDAACLPEPLRTPAMADNDLRDVLDLFTGPYEDMPIVGYSTTTRFRDQNPNTFAAVQRAMTKALEVAHTDPDRSREVLSVYTRVGPETAKTAVLPTYPTGGGIGDLSVVADLMDQLDVIDGPVKVPEQ